MNSLFDFNDEDTSSSAFSVTALNNYIKSVLETNPMLLNITLKGEISNFKKHYTGHLYFSLKDETSSINCTMWVSMASKLGNYSPKEGDKVEIKGKIGLYVQGGSYSVNVTSMKLDGLGDLYGKYLLLIEEYKNKGYFDLERKRELPKFPLRIGVITSSTGAVREDIIKTINRRYRLTEVLLYQSVVQGPDAKKSISDNIIRANKEGLVDVLIVGRGGGSIEDLWAFNEPIVIEAIYNSKIPIITAIGHGTDKTISDMVGDKEAPTPTAAAELATPNMINLLSSIDEFKQKIVKNYNAKVDNYLNTVISITKNLDLLSPANRINNDLKNLDSLNKRLSLLFSGLLEQKMLKVKLLTNSLVSPSYKISILEKNLSSLNSNLKNNYNNIFNNKNYHYEVLISKLISLNPLSILSRGFSISYNNGSIVKKLKDVSIGDTVKIELIDGDVSTKVIEKNKK
ncbi:MAG: exodeoxyribonuclease VII large subunit [Acholeplasmatales bacterium]|jgi:exodeoxyribonuclease VII large subunit|nr:exodeoxyribonuclease VII large subunit [Acholeplasmatales bacterium]